MPTRVDAHSVAAQAGRTVAEQTGRRLAAETAAALAGLPPECRSIRGMAAHLGVDPNVCQRAIAVSQLEADPLTALQKAPGVAGFRLLLRALRKRGVQQTLVDALDTAIEQFAHLLQESGGSHAKLQRRLTAMREETAHESGSEADVELRRRLFLATSAWLGSRLETHAAITIARPVPGRPDAIEGAKVNAFLGHMSRESSLPLVTANFYRSGEPRRDEPSPQPPPEAPLDSAMLMAEFSSSSGHLVSTRTDRNQIVQIIDPSAAGSGPIDMVVLNKLPPVRHPAHCARPLFFSAVRVEHPCRQLISDVWLERSLAAACTPTACLAWAGEPLRGGEGVPWYHRLPVQVTIELNSPDAPRSSPGWPRQGEATRRAFEMLGWCINDFVGYRLALSYPAWGAAAVITFDFSPARSAPALATETSSPTV